MTMFLWPPPGVPYPWPRPPFPPYPYPRPRPLPAVPRPVIPRPRPRPAPERPCPWCPPKRRPWPDDYAECTLGKPLWMVIPPEGAHISCPVHPEGHHIFGPNVRW